MVGKSGCLNPSNCINNDDVRAKGSCNKIFTAYEGLRGTINWNCTKT